MKNVKLGILGLGGMGQLHLKNCLLMKNLNVAVADKSKSALHRAREVGVKEIYKDYEELLQKARVDAVVVALPNFLHQESACLAAENGVDIFVEKPLARTSEECRGIMQSAKKNSVKLMVGFYQRFLDQNQVVKSMVDRGVLGDIELIACESVSRGPFFSRFPPSPVPEWWFNVEMVGGGALLDTGCHAIDLMRWLINDEASVQYVFLGYKFRLQLEDTACLYLQFNKGTRATLMTGWFASETTQRIAFYGTAGSASLGKPTSEISMKRAVSEVVKNVMRKLLGKNIEPYSLSKGPKAYYRELEHFIDCVREDKEPLITGKDGLEVAKLIDEAYQLWRSTNPLNKE